MLQGFLLTVACGLSAPDDKAFDSALDFLKRTTVQDVGRDTLVASYEKFIADNAQHPKVAQAMLQLAGVYQVDDPAHKLKSDARKSQEWQERAIATAPKGSALWLTTRQVFVTRYMYTEQKKTAKILDEIVAAVPTNQLALARVEKARMTLALLAGHHDDAATHATTLFRWYNDPARIPSDGFEKAELDMLMAGAGSELVEGLRHSSLRAREKRDKLKHFATHFHWVPGLNKGAEAARAAVPDDLEPSPPAEQSGAPVARRSPLAWLLYGLPVVVLLGVVAVRSRRKRAQAT